MVSSIQRKDASTVADVLQQQAALEQATTAPPTVANVSLSVGLGAPESLPFLPQLAGLERMLADTREKSELRALTTEQSQALLGQVTTMGDKLSEPKAKAAPALSSPELERETDFRAVLDTLSLSEFTGIIRSEVKTGLAKVVHQALAGEDTSRFNKHLAKQSVEVQTAVRLTAEKVGPLFMAQVQGPALKQALGLKGAATKPEANGDSPAPTSEDKSEVALSENKSAKSEVRLPPIEIPGKEVLSFERSLIEAKGDDAISAAIKNGCDIDSLISMVMMNAQQAASDDLRTLISELHGKNQEKKMMREALQRMQAEQRRAQGELQTRYNERTGLSKTDPRYIDSTRYNFEAFCADQKLRVLEGKGEDGTLKTGVSPNERHYALPQKEYKSKTGNPVSQELVDQALTLDVNPSTLDEVYWIYRSREDIQKEHPSFIKYLSSIGMSAKQGSGPANEAALATEIQKNAKFLADKFEALNKKPEAPPKAEAPPPPPKTAEPLADAEYDRAMNDAWRGSTNITVDAYDGTDRALRAIIEKLGGRLDPLVRGQLDGLIRDIFILQALRRTNASNELSQRKLPALFFELQNLLTGASPGVAPPDRKAAAQYVQLMFAEAFKDVHRAGRRSDDDASKAPEGSFLRQHVFTEDEGGEVVGFGQGEEFDSDEFRQMGYYLEQDLKNLPKPNDVAPPPPPTPTGGSTGANPFGFSDDWEAKAKAQDAFNAKKNMQVQLGPNLHLGSSVQRFSTSLAEALKPKDHSVKQPPHVEVDEVSLGDLTSGVENMKMKMDTLGDLTEEMSLRLQMFQERRQKLIEILSNVMKKNADTSGGIISNIK